MYRIFRFPLLLLPLFLATGQTPAGHAGFSLLGEARVLADSARYPEAIQRAQQALALFPAGDPGAGECLLVLGDAFLETGQWEAAAQQYTAALAVFQKRHGPRHLSTARAINSLGEYFYKKSAYTQAAEYYRKALLVREALLGPLHELVADSYNNLGNCRVVLADYAAATELHEKALTIRQKTLPPGHPDLATSWNNLGNCAYLTGRHALAVGRFGQALAIREKVFGPEHPKVAQVHNNLGNALAALGDYRQAIDHFRKAADIRKHTFGDRHPALAGTFENMADLYFDQGDFITALDQYQQAYAIQRDMQGEQSPAAAALWHKIGLCYQYEGDVERALLHHRTAEPALLEAFGADHPNIAGLYNNLGNCYLKKKDLARAAGYYERALRIFQHTRPVQPVNIALIYNNLGTIQIQSNRPGAALACFEKALDNMRRGHFESLPEYAVYLKNKGLALDQLDRWADAQAAFRLAADGAGIADPLNRVAVLGAWGASLRRRGMAQADSGLLRRAVDLLDTALLTCGRLQAQMRAPASKQRWIDLQFPLVADALEASFQLWKLTGSEVLPERAFALAERNKSLQLLDDMRRERAERFAGIPDSLLDQERNAGQALNQLEKQHLARLAARDTAGARALEPEIRQTRQALADLARQFERQYPSYYRLRYEQPAITPAMVREQLLHNDRALLEYTVTDSAVFVFVVTGSQIQWMRLTRDVALDEWVRKFRQSIQAYPDASGPAATAWSQTYADLAFRLYTAVFAPVEAAVPLPENLVIVPDGALAYVPFECLLSARPADPGLFKTHPYLLRRYRISYAHSAAQQIELGRRPPRSPGRNLLAVAPAYENSPYGLRPLQFNGSEARQVRALFDGDLLEGPAATQPAFLEVAAHYRVLLLATHGQASNAPGDLSYLAFSAAADSGSSPFLYARDLYRQAISADLVVLSACETSLGEYRQGQGVSSLAKGFFHAGARGVVATLWSVDDAKNAALVGLFFEYIKNGLDKDDALRRAKLEFLQTHPHDEAHPVYWAALTGYGDMGAVREEGLDWWVVVLLVLGVGGILGVGCIAISLRLLKPFLKSKCKIQNVKCKSGAWRGS